MTRIESRLVVSKSVEETFAFLTKRESHLNFIPRMISLTQTSQRAFAQIGSTANGMLNYFGMKIPVHYEVIEHEPMTKLAMKGLMGPVAFRDGYVLSKKYDGTEIKFWLELNPSGWTRILAPFAWFIGKIHAWETLRNLKREISR